MTHPDRIRTSFESRYTWRYEPSRTGLRELYEKAKREQWNATSQLAWETPVDPESEIIPAAFNPLEDYPPFRRCSAKEQAHVRHADARLAAIAVPARRAGRAPDRVAARLVRALDRRQVLRRDAGDGRSAPRRGVRALPAFGNLQQIADEPLLVELCHYVMRDEARHVAFGVLSLDGYYRDMSAAELRDREDFIIEASVLMRDRLIGDEIADVMGFDRAEVRERILSSPFMSAFRSQLFARVVPNVKRLGLLTPRVRDAYAKIGVLQFEDADPEAQDRALGLG